MITVNFYSFDELEREVQDKVIHSWRYNHIFQTKMLEAMKIGLHIFNTGNVHSTDWLRLTASKELIEVKIDWDTIKVRLSLHYPVSLGVQERFDDVRYEVEEHLTKVLRQHTHPDSVINSIHEHEGLYKLVFSRTGNSFYQSDLA